MEINPFQSPESRSQPESSSTRERSSALFSVRVAIGLLLPAGLFNFFAFDRFVLREDMPIGLLFAVRIFDIAAILLIGIVCWFLTVPVLEGVGRFIRHFVGRRASIVAWNDALYRSLKPMGYVAVPGAILWVIWIVGFYFVQGNFFFLSVAVGIPAHLLAAALYIPLFVRWFLLARTTSAKLRDEATT